MFDISAVCRPRLLQAFAGLWLLIRGRFLSQNGISVWRTPQVTFSKVGQGTITIDSRPIRHRVQAIELQVLHEAQTFLIPEG